MSLSEVRPASGNAAFEGVDAVRADGGLVHIRPVATSDANALRTLHARVSDRSMYLRFLALGRSAGEKYVTLLMQPDRPESVAISSGARDRWSRRQPEPGLRACKASWAACQRT